MILSSQAEITSDYYKNIVSKTQVLRFLCTVIKREFTFILHVSIVFLMRELSIDKANCLLYVISYKQ